MTWKLEPKELEGVLNLAALERYAYFVKRCADWEKVWGLRDDSGWVTAEDDDGRILMPIWPHMEYARVCATDEWGTANPASIELHEWVAEWLPDLEQRRHLVAVFPIPTGKGVAVEPGRLGRDLEEEIALYE